MPPLNPLTGSQTIHPNNTKRNTPTIEYSAEAQNYINFRRNRIIAARDVRDVKHDEFDNMTFLEYYGELKKLDDQYTKPRLNEQDISIEAGTVRNKDTFLTEYAMKYDFEPIAQVFNGDDDMLDQLAETMEDMVRKSNVLEDYRDKAKLIYRSMIAFGTAMVEEAWFERWVKEKSYGKGTLQLGKEDATWDERMVKQYDGCQSKLWDLRKCYFGDLRKFFLNGPQGQPYFFTVEYESYDATKQFFGDWDRWVNVPTEVVMTPEISTAAIYSAWWTLRPVSPNYCEIIRYYDPIANEYAIMINGIDMLPILERKTTGEDGAVKTLVSGFPLTAVSPSGAIPFAKFDLEPMHDFAYSKAQPAKMRVLAAVENMYIKIMLWLMKQKARPTMGNMSGRNFGPEITDPATVINDVREGDLFPVLPNFQGANQFDFSFYEIIKKEMDKNSVERSFQGIDPVGPTDETATGDMNQMKTQSLTVAAMFDGIISGERQRSWLRTYNIIENWTKPIDIQIDVARKVLENKYRSVSIGSETEGGRKATKKIKFTKSPPSGSPMEASRKVHQEEEDYKKENGGKDVRIVYIEPDELRSAQLRWMYSIIPVPNSFDPLAYMVFAKQVQDAIQMFGPDSLNVKKLKHRFAVKTGEDFDTWFLNEQELLQAQQTGESNGMGAGMPMVGGGRNSVGQNVQGQGQNGAVVPPQSPGAFAGNNGPSKRVAQVFNH